MKLAILFVGIIGGVGGMVLGNLLQYVNSTQVSMFASIISALFLITFMIMSPLLAQEHIYDGWAKDTEIIDIDNDKMYLFEKYQLSKREIEVCRLLLKGHTLRQISAMLSISYSTVNTYCTNCYRKLNISTDGIAILLRTHRINAHLSKRLIRTNEVLFMLMSLTIAIIALNHKLIKETWPMFENGMFAM